SYHLIYHALNIGPGDEVIIPSFFTQAPLNALNLMRGKPVLVDCSDNSIFPDIEEIKKKISSKTKGIVIGHLFGYQFNFDELLDCNVPIIEDISHSINSFQNDIPENTNSTFSVISFDSSMIITTGSGGMAITNNSKLYSVMREMRGVTDEYTKLDYNMTDFQGAMGISQLLKLNGFLKRRREIAKIYHNSLKLTDHKSLYTFNDKFAYQTFPVLFNASLEKINKYWRKNRIEATRPIKYPLHSIIGEDKSQYANCERMSKKLLSLPLYPTLTRKEIEKISKSLSNFI
ncbi:DegT/DnrJ/EryC1/StrS family aminotransferase, partial [Spirochaetota bacterium]